MLSSRYQANASLIKAWEHVPEASLTENGSPTLSTSSSAIIDLFFRGGAMRRASEAQIIEVWDAAIEQQAHQAFQVLFYLRDARGGQGERQFFRTCLTRSADLLNQELVNLIPEYGRFDDLLCLLHTSAEEYALTAIRAGLADPYDRSLAAKWMPREKQNRPVARYLAKKLFPEGKSYREYRKMLSRLSSTVEQQMTSGQWSEIDYPKLPSGAALKYQKAFRKRDEDRYGKYLGDLSTGKTTIHAGTLYPHQIVSAAVAPDAVTEALEAQWAALPNYLGSEARSILPVVDTSGSMTGCGMAKGPAPIDVAVSLGLYLGERNQGPFKDRFVTFSSKPALQRIEGGTLAEKIRNLKQADWEMNTDIHAVFQLILNLAEQHDLGQEALPEKVLILSDMEFDSAVDGTTSWHNPRPRETNFQAIDSLFSARGFSRPGLVFWNLSSRNKTVPVSFREEGTALVSGFSPAVMQGVLGEEQLTPEGVMHAAIGGERYSPVRLALLS